MATPRMLAVVIACLGLAIFFGVVFFLCFKNRAPQAAVPALVQSVGGNTVPIPSDMSSGTSTGHGMFSGQSTGGHTVAIPSVVSSGTSTGHGMFSGQSTGGNTVPIANVVSSGTSTGHGRFSGQSTGGNTVPIPNVLSSETSTAHGRFSGQSTGPQTKISKRKETATKKDQYTSTSGELVRADTIYPDDRQASQSASDGAMVVAYP